MKKKDQARKEEPKKIEGFCLVAALPFGERRPCKADGSLATEPSEAMIYEDAADANLAWWHATARRPDGASENTSYYVAPASEVIVSVRHYSLLQEKIVTGLFFAGAAPQDAHEWAREQLMAHDQVVGSCQRDLKKQIAETKERLKDWWWLWWWLLWWLWWWLWW